MKIEIIISRDWHSAIVKVGSCVREYILPGGFKKYRIAEHLRNVNYLDKGTVVFNSSMAGFSALYAFVTKYEC